MADAANKHDAIASDVEQLLFLFGYKAAKPRDGTYGGHGVTFYTVCTDIEQHCFVIDHQDSPEIVLWAIQQYEQNGMVFWPDAPYTEEWRLST